MKRKKILLICCTLIFIVIQGGILFAEEPQENSSVENKIAYLDNIPCSTGELSIIYKLQEDGTESPYYGRYQDPFVDKPFYVDRMSIFACPSDDSIIDFRAINSWEPSWQAGFEWRKINLIRFWGFTNDSNHFEMPDAMPGSRRDINTGFEYGCVNGNRLKLDYVLRESGESGAESKPESWKTRDADFKYNFQTMRWDTSFRFKVRNLDNENMDLNDIRHLTFTLAGDRDIGDSSFLRGNLHYSISDLDSEKDYKNLGGAMLARFTNALNVDGLDLTTGIRAQKNGKGPSRMHPLGSTSGLNIGAKWNQSRCLKLNASWDISRIRKSHPNENALDDFIDNPDHKIPANGEILENTLWLNRLNLGGRYRISDDFDFSTGWKYLRRSGMSGTDLVEADSPHLYWNCESTQDYTLRYHPFNISSPRFSDWELKYTTNNRSNSQRDTSDDDSHLTINWISSLDDNLLIYTGWGYLKTSTKNIELRDLEQTGHEYGFGFEWDTSHRWNLHGDWWKYDVSGADGSDHTNYILGIGYKPCENFTLTLEYEKGDGEFDDISDLGYDVKLLKLKTSYNW
jgi:hypothetical protein